MAYDLLIKNGKIVDGSGAPAYVGDVVVDSGRIVSVGRKSKESAAEVVDADGRVVAPGFIDPHTHVDPQLWWDPFALPLVLHGVTSVMTGNCAVTLAPCKPDDSDALASIFYRVEDVPLETLRTAVPWSWGSFDQYLRGLDGRLGINCAALVGHCAVRYSVMGPASLERAATDEEVRKIRELVRESIRAGAIGFSTSQNVLHVGEGGVPIPSRWAEPEEVLALAEVLGEERRGIIQTDGGTSIAQRADWVRDIGGPLAERTGRTVLAGNVLPGFAASEAVIDAITPFRERGVPIYAQLLPSRLDTFFTLGGGKHDVKCVSVVAEDRLSVTRGTTCRVPGSGDEGSDSAGICGRRDLGFLPDRLGAHSDRQDHKRAEPSSGGPFAVRSGKRAGRSNNRRDLGCGG